MTTRGSHTFHATAIVLKHFDYAETDRILTLFTLEHGKIKAIAKGVRRINSRKAGHLEPFTQVNLFLARGRDLAIITQAETINAYPHIKENLQLMGLASYMVELLERFTPEEGENWDLFTLLVESLGRLERSSFPTTVMLYYEVRLMDLLGFRPDLHHCAVCSQEIIAEDQFFSANLGGVVDPRCASNLPEAWPVSLTALKYFRHFQRSRFSQIKALVIPSSVEKELAALIERYMTFLLEHSLKSPKFIREINSPDSYQTN